LQKVDGWKNTHNRREGQGESEKHDLCSASERGHSHLWERGLRWSEESFVIPLVEQKLLMREMEKRSCGGRVEIQVEGGTRWKKERSREEER